MLGRSRTAVRTPKLSLLGFAFVAACVSTHESRRGDRVDVSDYPPEIQEAYRVFAYRCSRCHTLARPLNAGITDPQHWVRYVARMRRQPGSGIDRQNAKSILRFLLFYTERVREGKRLPAAPRGAPSDLGTGTPATEPAAAPTLEPASSEGGVDE